MKRRLFAKIKDESKKLTTNFVTPKGVLHLAKCDASATRKGL